MDSSALLIAALKYVVGPALAATITVFVKIGWDRYFSPKGPPQQQ